MKAEDATIRGKSAKDAFVTLAVQLCADVARHAETMARSRDPEGAHQFRVSLRRLRALLKLYRPHLAPDFYETANSGARDLAALAATTRRIDVAVTEMIPSMKAKIPRKMRERLIDRLMSAAERDGSRALAIVRTPGFLLAVHRALLDGRWVNPAARASRRLDRSVTRLARGRLERQFRRVHALGDRIDALTIPERHVLRKEGKALRYAIAFFAPLFPARKAQPMADSVRRLQNELGLLNDASEAALLAQFAPEAEFAATIDTLTRELHARLETGWPRAQARWRDFSAARPFWR